MSEDVKVEQSSMNLGSERHRILKIGYTCLGAAIMYIGLTKTATRRSL